MHIVSELRDICCTMKKRRTDIASLYVPYGTPSSALSLAQNQLYKYSNKTLYVFFLNYLLLFKQAVFVKGLTL